MHSTDLDVTGKQIGELSSPDAIARFFERLGYKTTRRSPLTPESIGLSGDSAASFQKIELLSEDEEGFLRVVFARPKSLTAKARTDLCRVLGKATTDHLLVLASDYESLEFVLLDKRKREQQVPGGVERVQVIPKTISVSRRTPSRLDLRTVRRFTWTSRDAIDQFDKLRSVFDAAAYTGEYFQNRGLFADYYLRDRLRDDGAWGENPADMFGFVRDLYQDSQAKWQGKDKEALRAGLFKPVFERLGFKPAVNRTSGRDQTQPDYLLKDTAGRVISAAFVYQWDRWLDGPDQNDPDTPEENPGGCVVTALDQGQADWVMVTNGRLWRLYSRQAHARSTNFYEVDLVEALTASGDTDPNEAFRYFWLFFRADAFRSQEAPKGCWLDAVLLGSREYAKRLGERLKERVFVTVFPHLAEGFLADRRQRLGVKSEPSAAELDDIFEATLTFLYRLLFLLYAESRDLLPVREAPYQAASLKKVKEEVAQKAGVAQAEVQERLEKAYSGKETGLYTALGHLFVAMDQGDPALNVPTYNGGLFITKPAGLDRREHRIAKFLLDHKVPDRHLALAIDLLARDQDEKSFGLVFIDYKSLEVRHLGSIYEGLLEFKLKIAPEDLTTQTDAKNSKVEKYVALSQIKGGKGKRKREAGVVAKKGDVYLSNSKAERKASGSYYTPDAIVEYIVANAVGPVLDAKLSVLEPDFRKVRKTFENELQKSQAYPSAEVRAGRLDHRQWAGQKTYLAHQELVERFFDLKVLDPAMGSGHFLVEAVDFITDRLLKFLNQFPINPVNFALERTRDSIRESLSDQGVTIDTDRKLTDINLLKRHVLKRCIYGVDLNPMAVELAKVSLWLDAFTLGAPLSFLDHHLRSGNSLVGASYRDLRRATASLLALDTGPLLRAIQHVLFVSKMSDATAAEATQSAERFAEARRALSGYRIVFDCLTAQHFGIDQAAMRVIGGGIEYKLDSRERFVSSITDGKDRELVTRSEAVAQRPEHRFFYWDIEFPEVFFGFRDAHERQPVHRDELKAGTAGFDVVVGNPPYDVLAEKELEADLTHLLAYFKKEKTYEPACKDKQNLYKLFICRGVQLLRTGGRIGHIVPMPLLGDEQAVGVRKLLLNKTALVLVEAFPQKDNPKNRVFEDAKLSTCVFVTEKSEQDKEFRSRVHPGKFIEENSPSLLIRRSLVKLYDPENQPVVACSQEDWDLAVKIMSSGRIRRLNEYSKAYQGEVNETTDGGKGHISSDSNDGPQILRGANICLYQLREASQGEAIYLKKESYLKGKKPSAKAWHFKQDRVGFQRNAPQNNFRRLIACVIPAGHFCCDTVSYFPKSESRLPLQLLVALFNSKFLDWFFRLGSTNSKVNDYQVRIFPVPAFTKLESDLAEVPGFMKAVESYKWDAALDLVSPLLLKPPFPNAVVWCLVKLAEAVTAIEAKRGDIARSERSALASKAQPYQDLLDKIIYRMAGVTDDEAAGLERRLETML